MKFSRRAHWFAAVRIADRSGRNSGERELRERAVCAHLTVIVGEMTEFEQKIRTVPEYDVVQILSAQCADQSFDERVRVPRDVWSRLMLLKMVPSYMEWNAKVIAEMQVLLDAI